MANDEHLRMLYQGQPFRGSWNVWRAANPDIIPDLSEADLTDVPDYYWHAWAGDEFVGLNLNNARLAKTKFGGRWMQGFSMKDADLCWAELDGCSLVNCDFTGANLGHCRLTGTEFRFCNLENANFCPNCLNMTVFIGS